MDSAASNHILDEIQKNKEEILSVIYEGIQNPVVASALHQHSEEYLTVIMIILNSMIPLADNQQWVNGNG